MTDLKELRKLIRFLRKEGITEFKDGGLEFKLDPNEPVKRVKRSGVQDVSSQVNDVPSDGPTKEELLYWSSGGAPTEPMEGN